MKRALQSAAAWLTASTMTTVLYVHGLESGPRGMKTRSLEAAGCAVVSAQMPCNRASVLRDPVVLVLGALAVGGTLALISARGAAGFVIAMVSIAVLQRFIRPPLARRVFRRSIEVQLRLLAAHHIDVVVGSSFGGAVALELLNRGAWSGPTVLLCPAQVLVAARGWTARPSLPKTATHVVVVHGRHDERVPLQHSRSLVSGTLAQLIEVEDDHRLSSTATAANFKVWLAAAALAPASA